MNIDKRKLLDYVQSFVMYEMSAHNVDPRKTLEGTSLRLKPIEGYKYDVSAKGKDMIQSGPPYVPTIMALLPGRNLVSFYQKRRIQTILDNAGAAEFEKALTELYEGNNDQSAFEEIVKAIGGSFDVLGFLLFLKNRDKYLPIRSSLFDERFRLLGFDSALEGNCTWEKYNDFISWISEIRDFLCETLNNKITLLDAHSFVWTLPWLVEYLDKKVQLVEHAKFGRGIVLGFQGDLIRIKFGKAIKSFDRDSAFKEGYLKFVPVSINLESVASMPGEKAIDVAAALLQVIASRKCKITYSELSNMTVSRPDPHIELPKLLDEINRLCGKLKLPCISALVVSKDTGMPGEGFRKICIEEFGYDEKLSKEEIYEKELLSIGKCSDWKKLAAKLGLEMPEADEEPLPEEFGEVYGPLTEGAKKQITVNAYERDPKAVKCCKDYYMHRDGKLVCQICHFDFGAVYGVEYANKIHIHHIKPISEIGGEYEVDPLEDLIPVCPNCHMVLHANGGITVQELRKKIGTK